MLIPIQKRQKTEVRKEQIIEATQKIIMSFGGEHVTIKRIAEEVGISEGAIYRHFQSKEGMFSFLLDSIGENLLKELEQSFSTKGDVIEHLHYAFITHISNITQRQGMSFQIIAEVISLGDKKLNQQLNNIINSYVSGIKNLLMVGVEAGEIRGDIDLDAASLLFLGMTESISNYWALNNYNFNLEEKTTPIWEIFREAIINARTDRNNNHDQFTDTPLNRQRNRSWNFFEKLLKIQGRNYI